MITQSYNIIARIPMTIEARNAGAIGRKFWWAHVGTVSSTSKRAACAKVRRLELVPSHADRLKAYNR